MQGSALGSCQYVYRYVAAICYLCVAAICYPAWLISDVWLVVVLKLFIQSLLVVPLALLPLNHPSVYNDFATYLTVFLC